MRIDFIFIAMEDLVCFVFIFKLHVSKKPCNLTSLEEKEAEQVSAKGSLAVLRHILPQRRGTGKPATSSCFQLPLICFSEVGSVA